MNILFWQEYSFQIKRDYMLSADMQKKISSIELYSNWFNFRRLISENIENFVCKNLELITTKIM